MRSMSGDVSVLQNEIYKLSGNQGWETKVRGQELLIKRCIFCDNDRWNLEINLDSGAYSCWSCRDNGGSGEGHFWKIRESLTGEKAPNDWKYNKLSSAKKSNRVIPLKKLKPLHSQLLENQNGSKAYLSERGITDDAIKHFKLSTKMHKFYIKGEQKELPALAIPYIDTASENIILVKYRTMPPSPKAFSREKDMGSHLFNIDCMEEALSAEEKHIILCGSELDVVSVWCAGFKNVVGASVGENVRGRSFPDEWVENLNKFDKITLVYDGDEKGRKSARELQKRLGEDKVIIVDFPEGLDANEILVQSGPEELVRYIEDAKPAEINGIQSITSVVDEMVMDSIMGIDVDYGWDWVFPVITERFGKKQPGDLICINGQPMMGKTTFAIDELLWTTSPTNPDQQPALMCCLEMTQKRITRKCIQNLMRVQKDEITTDVLVEARERLGKHPLHIEYHDETAVNIDSVLDNMTKSYKRFGTRIVVVDNLHILARGGEKDELAEQGKIGMNLKRWAVAHDSVVVLIVHPRKMMGGAVETGQDIRGSAATLADMDWGFTIYRQNMAPKTEKALLNDPMGTPLLDPKAALVLSKARDHSDSDGKCWLVLEGEHSRFREAVLSDFDESEETTEG